MAERYVVREGPGGTRLAGHSLWREGRPFVAGIPESVAECSCGAVSDVLPSNNQRKKWHAAHKAAVARGDA